MLVFSKNPNKYTSTKDRNQSFSIHQRAAMVVHTEIPETVDLVEERAILGVFSYAAIARRRRGTKPQMVGER